MPVKRQMKSKPRNRAKPYKPKKKVYGGHGAYYIKGDINASAKIPGLGKGSIGLQGGYMSDKSVITGHGAYNVQNIRHNSILMDNPPSVHNARYREGATIIRHREFVGLVTSSSSANTFKIDSYAINPAQSGLFPWLSSIAQNYEEYMIDGLLFEFKSTCSNAIASSTNLSLGNVNIAVRYDPTDPAFTSDLEMLNYEYAQTSKVCDDVLYFLECDRNQSPLSHLYTRAGAAASSQDLRFSDFGNLYISTNGLQGSSINLGMLYVSYQIALYKPKIGALQSTPGSQFKAVANPGTVAQNTPLGSVWTYPVNNNLACTLSPTVITLPQLGEPVSYLIVVNWNALTSMTWGVNTYTLVNCYRIKAWNNNAQPYDTAPQSGASLIQSGSICYIVSTVAGAIPTITLANNIAYAGASASCDIYITSVAYYDPNVYGTG